MTPDEDQVLAAVRSIPAPRTAPERHPDPACCSACFEAAARQKATDDWRALRDAVRTAEQLRADPNAVRRV